MSDRVKSWQSTEPLPRQRLFGFALGKVGAGIYTTVPGLLLLYYMTDTLAISAAVAGLVLVCPKIWDVFCAAYVGLRSDREAALHGRRTKLMMLGSWLLPVLFILLFSGPGSGWPAVAWVLIVFILATTAFELFDIPYLALPTEMSGETQERTRIMGWRIVATSVGVLVAGAVAPAVLSAAGGGRRGHFIMSAVMAVVIFSAMLVCTLSSRWVDALVHSGETPGMRQVVGIIRENRSFMLLLSAYLPHAVGIAAMQASMVYVADYLLGNSALMSLMFIALMGPAVFVVPAWIKISRRYGKSRTFAIATILYAGGLFAMVPLIAWGNIVAVMLVALVLGVAFAGEQVMAYSMLPDTVMADASRTGRNASGILSGAMQSLETAAFAAGAWVFSLILAATGFVSSTADSQVPQSQTALNGIILGFTVLPAILLLLTLPIIRAYSHTPAARLDRQGAEQMPDDTAGSPVDV